MKKFSVIVLLFAMLFMIASCGGNTDCTSHKDTNGDGKCDDCGAVVEDGGNNDDEKVTYTVTVKDESGSPLAGVELQLLESKTSKGTATTDASGVVSFKIAPTMKSVYAQIISIPDGYELDSERHAFADDATSMTITVKTETPAVDYVITVKDADGNGIAGIRVSLCNKNTCATPATTDESGTVTITHKFDDVSLLKIKLENIPEEFEIPATVDDDGYMFKFTGTGYDIVLERNN